MNRVQIISLKNFQDPINGSDRYACKIKGELKIGSDWVRRWPTLSHGERKKAQLAAALSLRPQILVVDEPSNHLDVDAQHFVFDTLSEFKGIGLLVSHDRFLLDALCRRCVFVEPPHADLRHGNYSEGVKLKKIDDMTANRNRTIAKQSFLKIKREAAKRRDIALHSDRRRSKKGFSTKDQDSREKINTARVSGKDGFAGKRLNQIFGRLKQAEEKLNSIKVKKHQALGIEMTGENSKRNTLFHISAGSISLGGEKKLDFPFIAMKPGECISLTGVNGCGKSSLLSHIVQTLDISDDIIAYLPQEIDNKTSREILFQARELPGDKRGKMMTIVSRLGSMPNRHLESNDPSPGEVRKIFMATAISNEPDLIIMDEPTNHLELPSIACLEKALMMCQCGLFLVSHDKYFLDAISTIRWRITEHPVINGSYHLET